MRNIEINLGRVRDEIKRSAEVCGRSANEITLLAVSKTKPAADIRAAHLAGQCDFGENYAQEAEHKIDELQDLNLTWHFIGPIQSNKTRLISRLFDWVHSVDRFKIAHRLDEQRPADKAPLDVLLQVNIDNEASKAGVAADQVLPLAHQIAGLKRVRLRGLMAIPAYSSETDQQLASFAAMKRLFDQVKQELPQCDTLSMGMSGDMQAAIAQGSTLVRIGTAIFGARDK